MELGLIALIVNPVLVIISTVATYLITKRKNQAEVHKTHAEAEGLEIENIEHAMRVYKIISEDLNKENKHLLEEKADLKKMHEFEIDQERKTCSETLQLQNIVIKELNNNILIQKNVIAELENQLKNTPNAST